MGMERINGKKPTGRKSLSGRKIVGMEVGKQ